MGDGTLWLHSVSVIIFVVHIIVLMPVAVYISGWYQKKCYRSTASKSPVASDGIVVIGLGL